MTWLTVLRLACGALTVGFTLAGVALFARACAQIVARMRLGTAAPDRARHFWRRTGAMLSTVLGHTSFRGRPWIRVAHWLVMVSFPLLFLTLVTGYGQVLAGPRFALPWLDHQVWWNWLVEVISWTSLAGILALIAVRTRNRKGGATEPPFPTTAPSAAVIADAAPSAGTAASPTSPEIADAEASPHATTSPTSVGQSATPGTPGAPGTATRTSRFAGSSNAQARFVEAVILTVVLCVLALRMGERALLTLTDPASSATSLVHFPLTAWATPALTHLGTAGLEAVITVVATIKVAVSMSWMLAVGLQPSMGVAWHRFLAIVNVYARRWDSLTQASPAGTEGSGSQARGGVGNPGKALGPALPLEFTTAEGARATLTADTMDDLEAAMEAAEESGTEVQLGAGRIGDFTWKGLLDFSTCTECGRCQDLCPAWNTGKPLSPKLFTLALRDHHAAVAPYLAAARELGLPPEEVTEAQAAGHGGILASSLVPSIAEADASADPGASPESGTGSGSGVKRGLGARLAGSNPVTRLAPGSAHTEDVLGALLAAKAAPSEHGVATKPAPIAGEVLPADVLWSCTTCGACVDQCPVDIEHVDHIIDIRRQQVLMESAFPKELGKMFRGMETKGNPWGLAPRKRMDWAKGLDFEVPVIGDDVEDASSVEYLFWVGCAGAYEDRAKKTTRAVAELLHIAGVSFAVLGDAEACTGDPARRAGNEILFQMLAAQNVETLNEVGAQRIVVTCAHCFNTLAREYPQVGGHYEVLHYTQLLNRLVRDGKLTPVPAGAATSAKPAADVEAGDADTTGTANAADENTSTQAPAEGAATEHATPDSSSKPATGSGENALPGRGSASEIPLVTYHDACYLGRHNQVYAPPRELLEATGARVTEMPRNHERAFCCGGGGARAFMEESIGTRIAVERSREAIGTGASVIATACPFCTTMLSDGVASEGADVRVTDVATLMLEAVHRA